MEHRAETVGPRQVWRMTSAASIGARHVTLVLAVLTEMWLVCVQIGDGDLLVVQPDGRTLTPVPSDPSLIGDATTSLCQSDAAKAFRFAVVDVRAEPLLAVMLATDGYGNA